MVYLIHLSQPFKHAQHYLGFVGDDEKVLERLAKHEKGIGSRMLRSVNRAGIKYFLARCWPGFTRDQERQLKNRKNSKFLCPICNPSGKYDGTRNK